jgi:hypothetical protein
LIDRFTTRRQRHNDEPVNIQKIYRFFPFHQSDAQFIHDEIDALPSLVLVDSRHRKIAGRDDAAKLLRGVAREPR